MRVSAFLAAVVGGLVLAATSLAASHTTAPGLRLTVLVKLKDDGAIALPLADPASISFAIVEPPYEPAAVAAENEPDSSAP